MNQIYVVEGKNDVNKLKEVFPNINVVSVNGSEIDLEVVKYLKTINNTHEIIIITDPDFPGIKIRNELEKQLNNVSHIFLDRSKSFSKNRKKIGLEHLSKEDIIEAFSNVYRPNLKNKESFTLEILYNYKLIGDINSKSLREFLAKELNIGFVNGKQLVNRLNNSNVTYLDIEKIIEKYNK